MPTTRFALSAAALSAALAAGPALAAKPAPTRAPSVQAVVDCRKIDDGAQRLACYDAAVAKMDAAQTNGDLVTLDRQQRREVRRQAFGLMLPSLAMFDVGEKGEEVNKISETLASARQDPEGKWTFVMNDGQVWRQIDDEFLSRDPHGGSSILITRALIGSFMLSVDGQPGVRVHRDN